MRIFPDTTGMTTGLCLFGAGFGGENDARWLKEDGVQNVTVVDNDEAAMRRMGVNYPDSWTFYCQDAYAFLDMAIDLDKRFDVISIDQPMDETAHVHSMLPSIWLLANKMLVVLARRVGDLPVFASNIERIYRTTDWEWWVIRK